MTESAEQDPMSALPPEVIRDLHRRMVRIRLFEETAGKLMEAGKMPGFLHLYVGQEAVAAGVMTTLRADDVFHSHNNGPFYTGIPGTYYAPGLQADPATNMLNLRGTLSLTRPAGASRAERLELSVFVSNLFDAQPTLLKRNKGDDVSTLYYATTFRPRTVGLTGTWQF